MSVSALKTLCSSERVYDKEILRNHILSLKGREKIAKANVPDVVFYLGNDFNHLAIQILKLFGPIEGANLLGILQEFYPKFGVLINSAVLRRYWKSNSLAFLKWNPKNQTGVPYGGVRDLSSGTRETGEIDILVDLEDRGALLALSSKASGISLSEVGTPSINQAIDWSGTELRSMLTVTKYSKYVRQKNYLSGVVTNKKTLMAHVPDYAKNHNAPEFLVDGKILQEVVREVFDYVVENSLTNNTDLDKGTAPKKHIELWRHQEDFKEKCLAYKHIGGTSFLAFHLPRSGKTVSAMEIAIATKAKLVLLVSSFPHINYQWKKDTIQQFSKYGKFEVIDLSNGGKLPTSFDPDTYYFIMVSLQDLKMKSKADRNSIKRKLKLIFATEFDLIIQDEIHQGFETPKTRRLLKQIKTKFTLALSATAEKNMWLGSFNKDNTHYWDLKDERALLANPLIPEHIKAPYRAMPGIRMLRVKPDMALFADFKEFYTPQEGFLARKLFQLKNGKFVHYESIKRLFWYILDCQAEMAGHFSSVGKTDKGAKDTVRNNPMAVIKQCQGIIPEVSLFFVSDTKIQVKLTELLKESFADYLEKNNIEVVITSSKINKNATQLNAFVEKLETSRDKKFFVILVDQLGVGTTIRRCSAVFLLEDGKSLSAYWQRSFRNRTYDFRGNKPYAFVFDLNPTRGFAMEYRRALSKGYQGKALIEYLTEYYANMPVFDQDKWLNTVPSEEAIQIARNHALSWISSFENLSGGFNSQLVAKDMLGKNAIRELLALDLPGLKSIKNFNHQLGEMNPGKVSKTTPVSSGEESSVEISDTQPETIEELAYEKLDYLLSCVLIMLLCGRIQGVEIKTLEELAAFFNQTDSDGFSYKHLFNEILTGQADKRVLTPNQYKEVLKKNVDLQAFEINIHRFHREFPGVENFDFTSIQLEHLKKKVAEVITPVETVNEQLDKFPKEIWTQPGNLFGDFSMGTGTYLCEVKKRLMISLATIFPDPKKREKHIVENMLVGQDLLNKNVIIASARINPNGYNFRVKAGDSFAANSLMKKVRPNILIGNLPFQKNGEDGDRLAQNHNMWGLFLAEYVKMCPNQGYISVICPNSWYSPTGKERENIFNNFDVLHLEVGTTGFSKAVSWFVAHKTKDKVGVTKTVSFVNGVKESAEGNLNSLPVIPNAFSKDIFSLLNKFYAVPEKLSFSWNSELHSKNKIHLLSEVKNDEFCYGVKHSSSYDLYSSVKHSQYDQTKVLLTKSGHPKAYFDEIGEWGVTEATIYYPVKDIQVGANFTKLLNSALYQFIFSLYKWGSGYNHAKVFKSIPFVELTDYSDDSIFLAFGLNEDEIKIVKAFKKA
jgi:hypothetical protein